MPNLKTDNFYDVQCTVCGSWRSTDYSKGYETSLPAIRKLAKQEGWTTDAKGFNICPLCVEKRKNEFERMNKHE